MTWRVRDRGTFEHLTGRPRRHRGPVSLAVLPGEEAIPPRLAYAVGRRVGSAVVRNRVRRRLRAAAQAHRAALRPGSAYLFGAGPAAAGASFAELDAAVGELLRTASRR